MRIRCHSLADLNDTRHARKQQVRSASGIVGGGGGGGTGGREPGRTGGGRGTGGGISTMAGSGREIQKVKLFFFVTAYFQSKKRTQQRFLTSI